MLNQQHLSTTKALLDSAVTMQQMSNEEAQEIVSLVKEKVNKPGKKSPEELLRTSEACRLLKTSKPTLLKIARRKGISIIKIGATLRFRKSDIMKLGGLLDG